VTVKSASNPRRIGLFGGTFNPIHNCHLKVAALCRDALCLDEVHFMPAGSPPLKQENLAPAAARLAMTRLAAADQPTFKVSDLEIQRRGPSYTLDTLRQLKSDNADTDWHFILGLDAMLDIARWHQPEAVLRETPIAVLYRSGNPFEALTKLPLLSGVDFSPLATGAREQPIPVAGDGIRMTLIPIPPCPHSATASRATIRSGQQPAHG